MKILKNEQNMAAYKRQESFLPLNVPGLSTTHHSKGASEIVYQWATWTFVLLLNDVSWMAFLYYRRQAEPSVSPIN